MNIEIPLMLFLLLEGIGVGTLIAAGIMDLVLAGKNRDIIRWPVWIGFTALAAGLFISLTHLGHPERFWLAYGGIGRSWLSMEALFGILTAIAAALYAWILWRSKGEATGGKAGRLWIAGVVIVLGLVLLVSTAMIYASLRAIPLWNSALLIPLILVSALTMGILFFTVLAWKPLSLDSKSWGKLIKWCLAALIVLVILNCLVFVQLKAGSTDAAKASLAAFGGQNLWITLARYLIGFLLPLILAGMAIADKDQHRRFPFLIGAFAFLLVGEILGKVLFFLPAIHVVV